MAAFINTILIFVIIVCIAVLLYVILHRKDIKKFAAGKAFGEYLADLSAAPNKSIFLLAFGFALASVAVFFSVPYADSLVFSGEKLASGREFWRLFTFFFIHVDAAHLATNIIAAVFVALLAHRFEFPASSFLFFFIAPPVAVALMEGSIAPSFVIAGLSAGIYSVLGALVVKGQDYVPKYILIPIIGLSPLIEYVSPFILPVELSISRQDILYSIMLHIASFAMGIGLYCLLEKLRDVVKNKVAGRL